MSNSTRRFRRGGRPPRGPQSTQTITGEIDPEVVSGLDALGV
ncbi:MAG: hypothetical protein RL033_4952, partial [Pseudomonadota bacterium]